MAGGVLVKVGVVVAEGGALLFSTLLVCCLHEIASSIKAAANIEATETILSRSLFLMGCGFYLSGRTRDNNHSAERAT